MRVDNGVAEMPPELIDTLWNVNYNRLVEQEAEKHELIDTLWNVNLYTCE